MKINGQNLLFPAIIELKKPKTGFDIKKFKQRCFAPTISQENKSDCRFHQCGQISRFEKFFPSISKKSMKKDPAQTLSFSLSFLYSYLSNTCCQQNTLKRDVIYKEAKSHREPNDYHINTSENLTQSLLSFTYFTHFSFFNRNIWNAGSFKGMGHLMNLTHRMLSGVILPQTQNRTFIGLKLM